MVLARHVDPEDVVSRLRDIHLAEPGHEGLRGQGGSQHLTPYMGTRYEAQMSIPKFKIPDDGAPSDTVYYMIKDDFVNTYGEANAQQLMIENFAKNLADSDEYPAMLAIHDRCISILAHLWGVQSGEKAVGSATTGSSEAIHLGGLAMKRRWQEKRQAEGKDTLKPNIIMGSNAQVALEKFARYFDVEARILPVSAKSKFRLDPDLVRENIDENTIGIFVILGSTYTGHYEPVEEISKILDEYQEKTGIDIPIHVDAASGGFVAPFTHCQAGGPKWNFELPRVKSINASGHKYGLVYAGVGWIVWRDESFLPQHLIFELHYLGGTEKSFTLNFSRPGAQVIVQYYNLIHLGFSGYREIMENCLANARLLSNALEETGWYHCVSDVHRKVSNPARIADTVKAAVSSAPETSAHYIASLPVVSFRFSDEFKKEYPHIKQENVSLLLRARQWIIPNYALPPNEDHTEILRVVIRESMSFDLLDRLISDICQVTQTLMDNDEVDLSVLHKNKRKVLLKSEQEAKKGDADKKRSGERGKEIIGGETKKMAEGIHRSVC
ncbi:putative glutamate decarboxylase protein [Phaeoacremonium minimum UCRPA7]|uniref:Glutamate decarboxylase n=1 Tax=Phaeoacremonium minimum (strain UCR-PA7) TaxID=1286976 RepID=R8BK14_PHAM7|nr:putative glutamate decarboxylase protein [Phaeoacremonium minimum UCRPA7]EON99624.1 putative glutamate decarboxylase protein [Phaeoacremonium minimum UCRPA7]